MSETERITSRDNRSLINARNVRDGKAKSQIFVEGRRLVNEALRSDLKINEAFFSDDFKDEGLIRELEKTGCRLAYITTNLFAALADTDSSQGVIVLADRPALGQSEIEEKISQVSSRLVIFLKEINNPSNLGAILRSAEAAGVAGVITSTNSSDPFSPKSIRSAMGSAFRLPVWEAVTFNEILQWAKTRNIVATAADISADTSYAEVDWSVVRLLIFGSEAHGLSNDELHKIDEKVKIPMQNGVESLNLAVSAAILMFESQRHNHFGKA